MRHAPRRPPPLLTAPAVLLLAVAVAAPASARAQDVYEADYHASTGDLLGRGFQALTVCNGLFLSGRTLEQIEDGELRAGGGPAVPMDRLHIDGDRKLVAVPGNAGAATMRAVLRPGLGCVAMAPDQDAHAVDDLPALRLASPKGDPATVPWPDGDLLPAGPLPADVDAAALEAAGDWAFDRVAHGGSANQVTLSLLVVRDGRLVYERYAPGVDVNTRTRTWSTAKSVAATLVGIGVMKGLLDVDKPLPVEWVPDELNEIDGRVRSRMPLVAVDAWPPPGYEKASDPRRAVTLRHALNMSSGLYPVDNEYGGSVGSPLTYYAGWSSARQAVDRGLVREPGSVWDYENYDTLLGVLALREALGDRRAYLEFPRRELLDRIGMRSTVPGVDRFGDYVLSSQVYTNARDLARLGLLYLGRGLWNGERILPEWWADFVRTPAPATRDFGGFYGAGFWVVPDARTDVPQDAYTTAGARGQYAIIVPSQGLVIVRRGLDGSGPGFSTWDLVVEVMKAFPRRPGGEKAYLDAR